jgi:general secretion pathway protein J
VTRTRGFTLLELIVVLLIFAIVSVMAYGGLATVLNARERVQQSFQRTTMLQKAYVRLRNDLQQLRARPSRDPYGEPQPALVLLQDGSLEFTRSGWRNPLSHPRSALERVAYRVDDDGLLLRTSWRAVDRAQNAPVVEVAVLDQVEELRWRFLEGEEWREEWPMPGASGVRALDGVPRAVEVALVLKDLGEVRLLFSATNPVPK